MNYIIFTALVQSLLAIFFLAKKHRNEPANILLIVLLAGTALHLATKFFIFNVVDNTAVSFRMHTCLQLGYGPLLYLYARKIKEPGFLPVKMWFLFVPLIMAATLYSCVFFGMAELPRQATAILSFYNNAAFIPIVASHIAYGLLAKPSGNSLISQLKYSLVILGILEIMLFATGKINPELNVYIRCCIYLLLGCIPLFIVWDKTNSITATLHNKNLPAIKPEVATERKLMIPPVLHGEIFEKLEKLLAEKKLYKDENLSLEKLSTEAGLSRHQVSETLNVFAQKSFYQYVNEYRINEVLHHLDNPQKKTRLLAIAYDSGFKTKASFNQYFKKITGTTPSEYLKQKAA